MATLRRGHAVRDHVAGRDVPWGTVHGAGVTPEFVVADPAEQWEVALQRALDLIQPMPASTPPGLPSSQ